jgi:hypothetical protein
MRTYSTWSKVRLIYSGSLSLLIGSIFALVGFFMVAVAAADIGQPDAGKRAFLGTVCLLAGFVIIMIGRRYVWKWAYEVRLGDDGSLEFVSLARTRRMRAQDLIAIDRTYVRLPTRGEDPRQLVIRSRDDSAHVPFFPAVEALIGELQAKNPSLTVPGNW